MIHWLGYAEMRFDENANLVLARAVEQSGSEALSSLPDAWLVEDRSITLSVETESARGQMIAVKRLLSALLLEAEYGEAVIEVPPYERWSRNAGGEPSLNQILAVGPDGITPLIEDPNHPTIVSTERDMRTLSHAMASELRAPTNVRDTSLDKDFRPPRTTERSPARPRLRSQRSP